MTETEYEIIKNRVYLDIAIDALQKLTATNDVIIASKKVKMLETLGKWKLDLYSRLDIKEE